MPCDYKKYPENWKTEIRPAIMKRAKNKCEQCGLRNYSVGYRDKEGVFNPTCGNIVHDLAGRGFSYPSTLNLSYKEAKEICDSCNECNEDEKYIVIVLTIAHLNHDTKDNRPENLAALCQKCHNQHDVNYRKNNTKSRRKKELGIIELDL